MIPQELFVTYLDFGFIFGYSILLAGVTLFMTRKLLSGQMQLVDFYMTIVPFFTGLFDALENFNLILMLSSPTKFPVFSPFLASFFAAIKFSLLIVVIAFWITIVIWLIYQRVLK